MTVFQKIKLGALLKNGSILDIQDGNHGELHPKASDYIESGEKIPFIMANNIRNNNVDLENCKFIPKQLADQLRIGFAKTGDVLLTHKGTVGEVTTIKQMSYPYIMLTPQVTYYRVDSEKLNPQFLSCYFRSPSFQSKFKQFNAQSTRAYVGITAQKQIEIEMTDLPTQYKIASVISAYDDLIENNEKRIKALEEMAQLLYTEWFVKFKFPDHEKVKIVDSGTEYGMIPDGWEVKTVEESFEIFGGGTPSRVIPEYWGGEINWYTPTDLTGANQMFTDTSSEKITGEGLRKSSAKLFSPFSVMMTSRATIGAISINTHPATTNQGFITCIPNEKITLYYLYYWLKQHVSLFIDLGSGATFKEINKGNFKKIKILCPQFQILKDFETLSSPIMNLILRLQRENGRLSKMRDLLIPQLVTGKRTLSTN